MSDKKWTPEQLEAIKARECNLLVAAAAGSGKTAVLVERVIQRLLEREEPLELDRLLVVTFTEAAAMEMRSRIGSALEASLSKNPRDQHLRKQLALLNRASISTMHSFCLSIVRRYFFRLGLDPVLDVMSDSESLLLQQEILDQVLEEQYTEGSETFFQLAETLGTKSEEGLRDQVLRLFRFLSTQPFPNKWITVALKPYEVNGISKLEEFPWYQELLIMVKTKLEVAAWNLNKSIEMASRSGGPADYLDNLKEELDRIKVFLSSDLELMEWDELCLKGQMLDNFSSLPRIKKGTVDEELKNRVTQLRDDSKDIIRELQLYFQRRREDLEEELTNLEPLLRELVALVQKFQQAYQKAKGLKGQVDFNDLEHYCLELLGYQDEETGELKPTDIALELREQYQEVMVDEYQDTNDLQEAILYLVSRQDEDAPNLFMVGDVKQSIYRFRLANPRLFLDKYVQYPKDVGSPNRKVVLSANFRSRREVVDGVNFIFQQIMDKKTGELDYDQDAELIYRAHYPEPSEGIELVAGPIEVHLLNRSEQVSEAMFEGEGSTEAVSEEDLTSLEKEAQLIAYRIRQLVGLEGEPQAQVWDQDLSSYRPVSYKDIVVLLRSTKDKANTLLSIFQQYEIPAYAELGTGYFQAIEVSIMLSLLQIIDNPDQDIPLVAVLRSPLLGLTSEDLATIRTHRPQGSFLEALGSFAKDKEETELATRLGFFLNQLEKWRTLARRGPLSQLIWQIYQETAFLDYAVAMPGGRQRKANLNALYDRAREFDSFARHGLFRFLRFIEKLQEKDEDLGLAGAFGESDNVVRIMSIHKSKGLEFPVVFLADLGRQFNLKDLNNDLLLHQELGFGPMNFDLALRVKYPTAPYWAIRFALHRASLAEELRVLYVALTRAREKLILVGSAKKLEIVLERWLLQSIGETARTLPLPILASANSFLDWIGPALARREEPLFVSDTSKFKVHYWGLPEGETFVAAGKEQEKFELPWAEIRSLSPIEGVKQELYKEELDKRLTWKYPFLAATARPAKLAATELKRRLLQEEEDAQRLLVRPVITSRPRFIQEAQGLTGAELGTAMHLVMQHLDFQDVETKERIMTQIEKMVEQEFLTEEQAQAVGWKQFLDFFQEPLGQRLLKAPPGTLKKEVPFTLAIPAGEIYPELANNEGQERVLIQGIIDCLLIEDDGIILIDYKTDRIKDKDLTRVVAGYRHQLNLYVKAVEQIYSLSVKEKHLYFFHLGQTIIVD